MNTPSVKKLMRNWVKLEIRDANSRERPLFSEKKRAERVKERKRSAHNAMMRLGRSYKSRGET